MSGYVTTDPGVAGGEAMTLETIDNGGGEAVRLVECPFCDADLRDIRVVDHFPCEEAAVALSDLGE